MNARPEPVATVSVIIPCRDVAAVLDAQLDALSHQRDAPPFEVVVVDNGSRDGTADLVARRAVHDPRVRLVTAADGRGANYARSRGVRAARAGHLAFCDADDVVGPRWIAAIARALVDHECVTGPLDTRTLNPEWLVRTRGELPMDGPRRHLEAVPVVPGGNMGIRRATLDAIGGFRDDLDTAGEDVELSLRLLRGGIAIHFDPDAVVAYRYRTDARALFRQGRAYGRAKPWLCQLVARAAVATPSRFGGWKSWLVVVAWLPRLRTREGRASWCWVAGSRLGQLEGCVSHRTVWL